MLDVIGAGATATLTTDWHVVWKRSPESAATAQEIRQVHDEGRNRPAVETKRHTKYLTLGFIRPPLWRDAAQLPSGVIPHMSQRNSS